LQFCLVSAKILEIQLTVTQLEAARSAMRNNMNTG